MQDIGKYPNPRKTNIYRCHLGGKYEKERENGENWKEKGRQKKIKGKI
jgi:hypothetical protein